jgi:hypothetical protein
LYDRANFSIHAALRAERSLRRLGPVGEKENQHGAESAAKSASSTGHKIKKAWEWGEHIHFAHFVWTTFLVPAPAVILSIGHWTAHHAASFWSLLVLTAPLTVAVTLIIRKIRLKDRLESGYWTYLGFPAIVLLGCAFLSSWSGVGKAFDWHKALPQGMARGQIASWMLVPLAALGAFYDVYGAGAFFISVGIGIVLALATSS